LADGAGACRLLRPFLDAEPAHDVVAAIHLTPEFALLHIDEADAAFVIHLLLEASHKIAFRELHGRAFII
jgi:hypothetical protein